MVNILVRFVHGDCLCPSGRPNMEVIDVDASSMAALVESVRPALHRNVSTIHGYICPETRYRFDVMFSIRWATYPEGDDNTGDLVLMSDAELENQVRMIERRGCKDILVVKFHNFQKVEDLHETDAVDVGFDAENATDCGQHSFRQRHFPWADETWGGNDEASAAGSEEEMTMDDVENNVENDIQSTAMGEEQHDWTDGESIPAGEAQDDNDTVLEDSSARSLDWGTENPDPWAAPDPAPMRSKQSSPSILVVLGPDREILAEVCLSGTRQTVKQVTRKQPSNTLQPMFSSADTPTEFRGQTFVRDQSSSTGSSDEKQGGPESTQGRVYTAQLSGPIATLQTAGMDSTTAPTVVTAVQEFEQGCNRQKKSKPAGFRCEIQKRMDFGSRATSVASQHFTPRKVEHTVSASRRTSVGESDGSVGESDSNVGGRAVVVGEWDGNLDGWDVGGYCGAN